MKNHWFLKQNCDFEGLGEERKHTDTPTDAHTHQSSGEWVVVVGRETGCFEGLDEAREEERGAIELIACELHPGR